MTARLLFIFLPALLANQALPAVSNKAILAHAKKGELDSALQLCKQRLKESPSDIFGLFMMGKLAPDGATSFKYFKKVVKTAPKGSEKEEALYRVAQYYFAKGKYNMAISFFRKQIKHYTTGKWNIPARYWMGQACLNYGVTQPDYVDSAQAYYVQLLKDLPNNHYYYTMALEGLAKARLMNNETESASETIKMALETAPDDQKPNLYFLSFLLARQISDEISQKQYAKKILSNYPNSLESMYLKEKYPQYKSYLNFSKSSKNTSGFVLQLGAFSTKENAEKTVKRLKSQGIPLDINISEKHQNRLYLLQTKSFPSRQDAQEFADKLLTPNGLSYYIIQKN